MTRILRLLMIAAIALPLWQPVAAADQITVCDNGNTSSEFVPVYGYWIDTEGIETQVLYPSTKFNGLEGGSTKKITAITFYSTDIVPASLGGATVVVRMGETYSTSITTRSEMVRNRNNMDEVYTGSLPTGSTTMTIELQTPYVYQGNNILIDVYVAQKSTACDHCSWVGEVQQENTAWNSKDGGEMFLPKMTITVDDYQEEVVNFGEVLKGSSTTQDVTIENAANATLETEAPFSVESVNGNIVTVKFAPADAASYTRLLHITLDGKNSFITLKGIGTGGDNGGPVATRDESFFKGINYTWTDSVSTNHTSNLSEIATDPDQIIAMLKKVYMDKSIPGNWYRSNAKASTDNYNDVLYTGVGKIFYSDGTSPIGPATAKVLDIAQYATITNAGANVSGMSTIYNYNNNNSWLTLSCYGAYQVRNNQGWIEGSNLNTANTSWDAIDIFQGRSAYFSSAGNNNSLRSTGSLTFYVTNCVQVKAYVSNGRSDRTATLSVQQVTLGENGIFTDVGSASSTNGFNTVLTLDNLDETKIYRVQLTGSNGNSTYVRLCEIGFQKGSLNNDYSDSEAGYKYEDSYGWNIEGTIESDNNNAHFKIDQYKPAKEGVTLLLLEMKDDFTARTVTAQSSYSDLRGYIAESIKSARVITEAKRTGEGTQKAGTIFKIDCDKMNNFFFLAKGQLMEYYGNGGSYGYPNFNGGEYHDYYLTTGYLDKEPPLFCHMFEQFSPAQTSSTGMPIDIYQELVAGDDFPVIHDCPNAPYCYGAGGGHYFSMYHSDYSADAADVRDMMFFVPDNRMMSWNNGSDQRSGGNSNADYFKYNPDYAPTMGMYVINQKPIDGGQVDGKDMYQLTLTWESNLDKFLPTDDQEYQLFQVITEDGVERYVPVYYMNSDGEYTDSIGNVVSVPVPVMLTLSPTDPKIYTEVFVPMLESSQQVTFAVRGQDATHFFDLKTSNTRDFVIPGLDPNELVEITDATHYSRFNPQTVKNCYSNKISIANTAMGLVNATITSDTKLTLVRSHTETVNGATTTVKDSIAEITFDKTNGKYTVTMLNQSAKSEYPNGKTSGTAAGYHANHGNVEGNGNWQQNYTVNSDGFVNFGSLSIYDNFVVSVADNAHPNSYTYQLTSNYEGKPTVFLKTKNGDTDFTSGAVWYAWNWSNQTDGKWVRGIKTNQDGVYAFYYDPSKTNLIFARMNRNARDGYPRWNYDWENEQQDNDRAVWNQTGDQTASDGKIFTITAWSNGGSDLAVSSEAGEPSTAHSNSFDVRVYKTDSEINNVYTIEQVDDEDEATDGDTFENEDLTFEEKVQYSSKKDILRYDVYRWGETEDRFIVDKVTGKDNEEQDLSPNGQADNQDGSYTTKMNGVAGDGVTVPYGSTDKWAVFVDDVPENETEAKAFTYAPVVETFATGKTADNQNKDRTDYNTYGGPLQNASIGKFEFTVTSPSVTDYTWTKTVDGQELRYAYYSLLLNIDVKDIPDGYEIYKIRAWREIDEDLLGEEYPQLQQRVSSRYKFEEITYAETAKIEKFWNEGLKLGQDETSVKVTANNGQQQTITYNLGTFGARKVRTSETETGVLEDPIDVGFFARIYFTRSANLANLNSTSTQGAPIHLLADEPLPADGKFYMVEAKADYTIYPNQIPTAVEKLNARQVVGVSYYNVAGIESDTPFDGVNIVVTRYSDGSTTTTKILK